MSKRTDIHRPSEMVPSKYEYVFSYNGATQQDGWPVPSFGINCEIDRRTWEVDENGKRTKCINGKHNEDGRCCVVGILQSGKKMVGNACKCTVCGANFVYGDVWMHTETQEYIHLGHTCSDKYNFLADRSEYDLKFAHVKAMAAREIQKEVNAQERKDFLAAHPGLEEALKTDHNIVRSIAENFQTFRKLSDKQIALVFKLQAEKNAPPQEKEKTVAAPIVAGRQTFTGTVVSAKTHETAYGTSYKMTVKVTTPEGVWLAWGTIPNNIMEDVPCGNTSRLANLRGAEVEVTATLQAGKDAHFAMTKRPTGKILKLTPDVEKLKAELTQAGLMA